MSEGLDTVGYDIQVEEALRKVAKATEKANNLKNLKKTEVEKKTLKNATTDSKPVAASSSTDGISSSLLERVGLGYCLLLLNTNSSVT